VQGRKSSLSRTVSAPWQATTDHKNLAGAGNVARNRWSATEELLVKVCKRWWINWFVGSFPIRTSTSLVTLSCLYFRNILGKYCNSVIIPHIHSSQKSSSPWYDRCNVSGSDVKPRNSWCSGLNNEQLFGVYLNKSLYIVERNDGWHSQKQRTNIKRKQKDRGKTRPRYPTKNRRGIGAVLHWSLRETWTISA
jgi:hypothetical protein